MRGGAVSGRRLQRASPSPHSQTSVTAGGGRRPCCAVPCRASRRASPARPLPLSLPGTAAEASPQREAHTATRVRPSSGLSRLAAPPGGSSLPPAARRCKQAAAEGTGNAPQPSRAEPSPPPAPPVSDAPGSRAAAAAPGQLFLPLYFIFFMLLAEDAFNFSTGLIEGLLAGEDGEESSLRGRSSVRGIRGFPRISAVSGSLLGSCSFPALSGARSLFFSETRFYISEAV